MPEIRRNWALSPFTMWRVFWGEPSEGQLGGTTGATSLAPKVGRKGARIHDLDNDLLYEAVITRDSRGPRLVGLTVLPMLEGQRITSETLRRVPVQRIVEQVSLHLVEEEGSGTSVYTRELHKSPQDLPTAEQIAADYNSGLRRRQIAAKYRGIIAVHTVDKRLREARANGLIAPPTTGRGHRKSPPLPPGRPDVPGDDQQPDDN